MSLKPLSEIVAQTSASTQNESPSELTEQQQEEYLLNVINLRMTEAAEYGRYQVSLETFFFRGYSDFVKDNILDTIEAAGYTLQAFVLNGQGLTRYVISWV